MSGARVERAQGVNGKLHSRCPRCSARVGGAGDVTDVVVAGPACRSGAHVLMRVRALVAGAVRRCRGAGVAVLTPFAFIPIISRAGVMFGKFLCVVARVLSRQSVCIVSPGRPNDGLHVGMRVASVRCTCSAKTPFIRHELESCDSDFFVAASDCTARP